MYTVTTTDEKIQIINFVNTSQMKNDVIAPQASFVGIDWSKVKTIADVKLLLESLDLKINENHPSFETLKKFL